MYIFKEDRNQLEGRALKGKEGKKGWSSVIVGVFAIGGALVTITSMKIFSFIFSKIKRSQEKQVEKEINLADAP